MSSIRPAAVAGSFYPIEPVALAAEVAAYLAKAAPQPQGARAPKAIIAPHAGYVYSAAIAASIYARLAPLRGTVRRVVLAGPAHRVYVRGAAVPSVGAFASPLGAVALDPEALAALRALPFVEVSDRAHALEHSLEVHIPFLQAVLGEFLLVPIVVGEASPQDAARLFDAVWGGAETLIVVSSDLSHYLPYEAARARDSDTASAIVHLDATLDPEEACGAAPINGLILAARRRSLTVEQVDVRNSGDTAGGKDRVVGYGAFAFHAPRIQMPDPAQGRQLVEIARRAIEQDDDAPAARDGDEGWLAEPGASFVTLHLDGELRGCIGSVEARRPIGDDVARNARAAAYRDPRFAPVTPAEWGRLLVEVSVLSGREPLPVCSEADALERLRPGVDGIFLEYQDRCATFLPQVWEGLPDPVDFLGELRRKAGLATRFWHRDVRLSRYTVEKFR